MLFLQESSEEVNYVGQEKGKLDPYSNTYNEGWKFHPNLKYGSSSPNYAGNAGPSQNKPQQGGHQQQGYIS